MSDSEGSTAASEDEHPLNGVLEAAAAKKASKRSRAKQRAAQADQEAAQSPDGGLHGMEVGLEGTPETAARPATAPAAVGRRAAHILDPGAVMVNLEWSTQDEIVQAVELKRLIRAPRYFDEDAGQQNMYMRCFNCGKMGHRALDCTHATRQKPCYLCAQWGHDGRECPNRLCFQCGRPGHLSRACTTGRVEGWESALGMCNRCGLDLCACAGKGDYFRYEGGCSGSYSAGDLKHCRCYVCGKSGHLCCKPPPRAPVAGNSCYCCGSEGHVGEDCPHENRPHLAAERMGDARKATAAREAEAAVAELARVQKGRNGGPPPRQHTRFADDDIYLDGGPDQRRRQAEPWNGRQDFPTLGRSVSAPRLGGPQYGGGQRYASTLYGLQQYGQLAYDPWAAASTAAVQQQYEGQRKVSTGQYSQHFAAPPQVQHSGSLPHFNMPSPAPYYMQQQQQQQRGGFASSDRYTDGGSARGGDGRQNPEQSWKAGKRSRHDEDEREYTRRRR